MAWSAGFSYLCLGLLGAVLNHCQHRHPAGVSSLVSTAINILTNSRPRRRSGGGRWEGRGEEERRLLWRERGGGGKRRGREGKEEGVEGGGGGECGRHDEMKHLEDVAKEVGSITESRNKTKKYKCNNTIHLITRVITFDYKCRSIWWEVWQHLMPSLEQNWSQI